MKPTELDKLLHELDAAGAARGAVIAGMQSGRVVVRSRPRPVAKAARPRCGARCRDGHACAAPVVWLEREQRPRNGRCRMHGGASTGPRTAEGRARVAAAAREMQLARWASKRAA